MKKRNAHAYSEVLERILVNHGDCVTAEENMQMLMKFYI